MITACITTIPGRSWWFRRASQTVRQQTIEHRTLYVMGDPAREQGYVSGRIAHSRNQALDRCKTEWIAYLDDDNFWTDDHLEQFLPYLESGDIIYSKSKKVFIDSTQSCEVQLVGFDPNASLINVEYAKSIGGWQESWIPSSRGLGWEAPVTGHLYEDLDFWQRAYDRGARIILAGGETWGYTPGPRPDPRSYESRSVREWKRERPKIS